MLKNLQVARLLKKVQMQGGARFAARGVLGSYVAASRERANAADGPFSADCEKSKSPEAGGPQGFGTIPSSSQGVTTFLPSPGDTPAVAQPRRIVVVLGSERLETRSA